MPGGPLDAGIYRPQPVRRVMIPKKGKGKQANGKKAAKKK
jgi:retron-type reverse transcriptase